ncbi:hypothetical protein OZX67_00085 [Bifidobacterium sp. ESL0728]|uniref:hypothetical protein n=1 Tax=Bifidobacterium sp. ESL0728 TaxID=2983220 RepID=UPI0023F6B1A0|nr:hypothetical protein [Bifidobacterium sp. ESL0728]WEV59025.1 hypothetical protein OZX67_00085 [Bifidobacterium sp. ESL0728]
MAEDPNLVIDDSYVNKVGNSCNSEGGSVDSLFENYVDILQFVADEGVPAGQFHDAIVAFKNVVSSLYGNSQSRRLQSIGKSFSTATDNFISQVKNDDKPLY